jgi:small subunit ribosomal protein S5
MTEEVVKAEVEEKVSSEPSSRTPREKGRTEKRGRRSPRGKKEVKEFEEEVLNIARVTRVVKGGRRMRFLATVAIGDKKGRVGIGTGKSVEVSVAIRKAVESAKKNVVKIDIVNGTIPFEKKIKYKAARMMMMPAPSGTGVIAGGAFRKVVTLAGITDIYAKSVGTNSKLVCAQASIKALSSFVKRRKAQ